jgi:hypothetical protein
MREKGGNATLGELLGKAGSKADLGLKDLPTILGEKMPELPRDRIGKFRLIQALQVRFGDGFRNLPMIKGILNEFDQEVETENVIRANKKGRE